MKSKLLAFLFVSMIALPASAHWQEQNHQDPWEPMNRYFFSLNSFLDEVAFRPIAYTYKQVVPHPLQNRVHDFLSNLKMPLIILNRLLQGEGKAAADAFARFLVNSTIGVLGFVDVAKDAGLAYSYTDYGITMAKWGVGRGPYIVWPLLGPSTGRDTGGKVFTLFTDPVNIYAYQSEKEALPFIRSAAEAVDFRSRYMRAIDDVKKNSVDYYAKVRSLYLQQQDALIKGEEENKNFYDSVDFPEYDDDLAE